MIATATLLTFVGKNWKLISVVAALVGLTIFLSIIYYKGKTACEQEVLIRTVTKTITIKEQHDKIRNHRPTSNGVITRLQAGNF